VLNYAPHYEDVWGNVGIAPRILKPRHQTVVCGQLYAPEKEPRYPLDSWLGAVCWYDEI